MPMPQLFKWSPRPDQLSENSPASQSSSRFGALQHNVRSMINGSSVYSQSPNPNSASNTPKPPFLSFLRRDQSPVPISVHHANDPPRDSTDSRSPLRPQHTAGSYMRSIAPLQDPREPEMVYSHDNAPHRHPADVPLNDRHNGVSVDPEIERLREEIHDHSRHRRRRRHRKRKHHRQAQWTRRRNQRQGCMPFVQGTAARGKLLACMISGLFLATVLAICKTPPPLPIITILIIPRPRTRPLPQRPRSRSPCPLHHDCPRHHNFLLSLPHPPLHAHPAPTHRRSLPAPHTLHDGSRGLPPRSPHSSPPRPRRRPPRRLQRRRGNRRRRRQYPHQRKSATTTARIRPLEK
jgi:hypothetical protein